jgi:hypothetical protein
MNAPPLTARPARTAAGKLHLRLEPVGRRTYRVASLRPGCGVTFATNHYHDTWHVLSDPAGAALLARLLWGLAFQKRPGTLVCIHGAHLRPTPFDADRSDPIVLVPTALTPVVAADLVALRDRLRRPAREGWRIGWPAFGLDRELDEEARAEGAGERSPRRPPYDEYLIDVRRVGGCVVIAGPQGALRATARFVHYLAERRTHDGSNYMYLGAWQGAPPGEVQVFDRYRAMLSEAAEARRRTLAAGDAPAAHDELLRVIGSRREQVTAERRAAGRDRSAGRARRATEATRAEPSPGGPGGAR